MAVDHNNPQSRDEEILIATIDGKEYNKNPQSRMEELLLELKETIEEGGGGGGTTNYENLSNQPQVNGETLIGDKTGADLGLVDAEEGKGLSTNDYDDTEKAAVAAATSAISAIKDGTDIDSFGDVEVALLDKADTSDLGTAAAKDSTNAVTSGSTDLVESGAVKDAIDAAVAAAYHHAGTKTVAQLTHDLLIADNEGNVYNITDSGTTTSDFIEGIGKIIEEGSNVGICKVGNVYMFDLLSGFVDTTNFVQKSQTAGLIRNDGTVNDEIEDDVDSLKSGLTNLDSEINGDAVEYPYADVITIPDAVPANVADCSVKIEPVQDLHGYDKPWVGGAGKNKAEISDATLAGTIRTADIPSGTVTLSGTTSESGYGPNVLWGQKLQEGTYILSAESFTGTGYSILKGWDYYANLDINGTTIAADGTSTYRIAKYVASGENVDVTITGLMIRLSTETDATFAPYTNICPITGHTEASVQRDGKNLFDVSTITTGKGITEDSSLADSSISCVSDYIRVMPNTTYYLTAHNDDGNRRVGFYDQYKNNLQASTAAKGSRAFTTPANCAYCRVSVATSYVGETQLELGSSATDYEPFKGKTYTIALALGDTIYGGTVDFDSGVMTVAHSIFDLGDKDWISTSIDGNACFYTIISDKTYTDDAKCSHFAFSLRVSSDNTFSTMIGSATQVYVRDEAYSNPADFKTAMSGAKMSYKLATPFTVQLTPQQIQLLKGTNTLTASTGQISVTVNGVSGSIGAVQEQVNDIAEDVADVQSGLANIVITQNSSTAIAVNDSYEFNADITAKAITICVYRYGLADSITVLAIQVEYWNNNNELYFVTGAGTDHVILKMQYNGTTKKCTATVKESTIAGIADTAVVISVVTMY